MGIFTCYESDWSVSAPDESAAVVTEVVGASVEPTAVLATAADGTLEASSRAFSSVEQRSGRKSEGGNLSINENMVDGC